MKQSISYNVSIWPEEDLFATKIQEFDTLRATLEFVETEIDKLFGEYGTRRCFAIEIKNLDSHKHVIVFDDDCRYERDNEIVDTIDLDETLLEMDDKYLYNFIDGYIRALIHC